MISLSVYIPFRISILYDRAESAVFLLIRRPAFSARVLIARTPRQRQVDGLLALRNPPAHIPFEDNSRIEQDHATAAEVRQATFVTAANESGLADPGDPGDLTRRYGVLKLLQAISDGIDPGSYGRCKLGQHFFRSTQHSLPALPAFFIYRPFRSASPAWLFGDVHYGNSDVTRVTRKRHEGNESHVCSSESILATRALKREGHQVYSSTPLS